MLYRYNLFFHRMNEDLPMKSAINICLFVSTVLLTTAASAEEYYQPGPSATGSVNAANWENGENRRYGLHHFDQIARFTMGVRPSLVRKLKKTQDLDIGEIPEVKYLTNTTSFSGLVIIKGDTIVYEKYAPDFGPAQAHSCQSTTKTINNLLVGKLVSDGKLDLGKKVKAFYPDMGSGYAEATVQQVLDMNVVNDYTEGYGDPDSPIRKHESVSGWRPDREDLKDDLRVYLKTIESADITPKDKYQYKSTNTDVVGMIVEAAAERPLHQLVREVMIAAGFENKGYITTDSQGVPAVMGGLILTTRDFARYGMLLRDGGKGVNGVMVGGGEDFQQQTFSNKGASMGYENFRYSNSTYTNGRFIAHAGWGGQYLYTDPKQDLVVAFHSTLENDSGLVVDYAKRLFEMPIAVSLYFDNQ
jgi:CubicO group peptidase (beta-lactamase class C family)